jgi:hypothetical protein
MTLTVLAPRHIRLPARRPSPRPRRWFGVAFGILLGLAAVCHGCHLGDHDDELSLHGGKPNVRRNDDAAQQKPPDETGKHKPEAQAKD